MADAIFYTGSTLAMAIVIAFSFYMVRHTKGKMSEGFKIILMGHMPIMLLHGAEAVMALTGQPINAVKIAFLEQTAQVIAAFSIFIAIYLIKRTLFVEEEKNGRE